MHGSLATQRDRLGLVVEAPRLGWMLRVVGDGGDAAGLFRDSIELAVAAEELGFEVLWLTQHHFGSAGSPMPSPLLLLAAMAERTSRIRLGTSVLTVTADHPIRVAEDAAVLDLLSGGRVELGLGAAVGPSTLAAFGLDAAGAPDDLARSGRAVRSMLAGDTIGTSSARLQPQASSLGERLWVASNTGKSVAFAGREGFGLIPDYQPERVSSGEPDYLGRYVDDARAAGYRPRVALVRSTFPTLDPVAARAMLEAHARDLVAQGTGPRPITTVEQYFDRVDFHWGHPDQVAEGLLRDVGMPDATDLLAGMLSAPLSPRVQLPLMRLMAEEVMPLVRAPRSPLRCD